MNRPSTVTDALAVGTDQQLPPVWMTAAQIPRHHAASLIVTALTNARLCCQIDDVVSRWQLC
jgi:hypothetical protein